MKPVSFFIALALLGPLTVSAQTADELVAQGRAFLAQQNIPGANARFADAVALAPSHAQANLLLATTRLLSLVSTPEGAAFMDRLGVAAAGRSLFRWTADLPRDTNGIPLAPPSMSAADLSAFLRASVVPALRASADNLDRITDTHFTLWLSADETSLVDVTLDYGDVLLLRSMLRSAEYAGYTLHSWNLDVQLTDLRTFLTHDTGDLEQFLAAHPAALTFATLDDLTAARQAFVSAVDLYLAASQIIRARPANTVRLFNYDLEMAGKEAQFRQTIADLKASLDAPVVLSTDTNLTIHLARHFDGQHSLRSFLPRFLGHRPVLGTLPDPTFGGLVAGWAQSSIERTVSKYVDWAVEVTGSVSLQAGIFALDFPALTGRVYAVECSTNLLDWTEVAEFFSTGGSFRYVDTTISNSPMRCYRLVDLSPFVAVAGRVLDRCSGLPVAGALVACPLAGKTAVTDAEGGFHLQTRLRPGSWVNFDITVNAANYTPLSRTFYASHDYLHEDLGLMPQMLASPPNDHFASRTILTGLPASASGSTCGATLEGGETTPPVGSPAGSTWWTWTSPFTGPVVARVQSPVSLHVRVFTGSSLGTLSSQGGDGFGGTTFFAQAGQIYHLAISSAATAAGHYTLELAARPELTLIAPEDGSILTGSSSVLFAGAVTTSSNALREVRIRANGDLIAVLTNSDFAFTWENVPPGDYWFEIEAADITGLVTSDFRFVTVRPVNDDFVRRLPLVGTEVVVQGNNSGASRESGEPLHAGLAGAHSIWWTWTAPSSGPATVSASGNSAGDLGNAVVLAVYTGMSLPALTAVASDVRGSMGNGSQVSFTAVAGAAYQIAVDGFSGDALQLQLRAASAPQVVIVSPPANHLFNVGDTVSIEAQAEDLFSPIVRVDFYLGEKRVGIVTAPPYVFTLITNAQPAAHLVQAVAVNAAGVKGFSQPVAFAVSSPLGDALGAPQLTWRTGGDAPWRAIQYRGAASCDGDYAENSPIGHGQESWIQTMVTGPGIISFRWSASSEAGFDYLRFSVDGVKVAAISGYPYWEARSHEVASGTHVLEWRYSKDDSVSAGQDRGRLACVSFGPPPSIVSQPVSQTAVQGENATFAMSAAGYPPLQYSWRKNGTNLVDGGNISGTRTATLTFSPALAGDGGSYSVLVSNRFGMSESATAILSIDTVTYAFAWARRAGGSSSDYGNSVATDALGNLYLAGHFYGTATFGMNTLTSTGSSDMFLAKLDSAGNVLWTRRAGGTRDDHANAVAVDASGNAYVAGLFYDTATFGTNTLTSSGGSRDMFLTKLDSAGNFLWARRAGSSWNDHANAVAVDASGNAYVTGLFYSTATFGTNTLTSSGGSCDMFLTKLDSAGNFLWARRAGGSLDDFAYSVAADASGNAYVTGYFQYTATFGTNSLTSSGGSFDMFLTKLDSAGNFLWARRAGGSSSDAASSVAVDASGNAYVAGYFSGTATVGTNTLTSSGNYDVLLMKLDGNGNFLWARHAGGGYDDRANAVAVDASGNAYVAGYFSGTTTLGTNTLTSSGYDDMFLAKLDGSGNFLWARRAGGSSHDSASSVAVDASGNVYATGSLRYTASFGPYSLTSSGEYDIFVVKLVPGPTSP